MIDFSGLFRVPFPLLRQQHVDPGPSMLFLRLANCNWGIGVSACWVKVSPSYIFLVLLARIPRF
jgi:hypothetical protein